MRKSEIHAIDCECPVCMPHCRHGSAEALAIATLTTILVVVTLFAVWTGARLEALFPGS